MTKKTTQELLQRSTFYFRGKEKSPKIPDDIALVYAGYDYYGAKPAWVGYATFDGCSIELLYFVGRNLIVISGPLPEWECDLRRAGACIDKECTEKWNSIQNDARVRTSQQDLEYRKWVLDMLQQRSYGQKTLFSEEEEG